jgi:hypothetical protein
MSRGKAGKATECSKGKKEKEEVLQPLPFLDEPIKL